jgi:hypothetical protein
MCIERASVLSVVNQAVVNSSAVDFGFLVGQVLRFVEEICSTRLKTIARVVVVVTIKYTRWLLKCDSHFADKFILTYGNSLCEKDDASEHLQFQFFRVTGFSSLVLLSHLRFFPLALIKLTS